MTDKSNEQYHKAYKQKDTQSLLSRCLTNFLTPLSKEGRNVAVNDLNRLFDNVRFSGALDLELKLQKHKINIYCNKPILYDQECTGLRKKLRTLSNQKHRLPNNQIIHQQYSESLKQYRYKLKFKKWDYGKTYPCMKRLY